MYKPHYISDRHFPFANDTVAAVYNIERDFIRLDDRIKYSPYAPAVRKTVLRGDALSTMNVNSVFPDIYTVMRIEAAGALISDQFVDNSRIAELLRGEKHTTFNDALTTYRYMRACEWITDAENAPWVKAPDSILRIYTYVEKGLSMQMIPVSFRETPVPDHKRNNLQEIYEAPLPEELYGFLQDLCDFSNAETLSPISQASIAQFQMEALRPFDDSLDRIERLMMHYIFRRRKLVENLLIPINLFSGHFEDRFFKMLQPYIAENYDQEVATLHYAEDLVVETTKVAQDILEFTISLHKMIVALIAQWKAKLGRVEKGSAVELLLYQFAGTPVMTTSQVLALTGKRVSTISEAFDRLENASIIAPGKPIGRHKTYEATDAIVLHTGMYKKNAHTIEEWNAKSGV